MAAARHEQTLPGRTPQATSVPRRRVHAAIVTFYMVAAILNGEALLRDAELMRYGRARDLAIALARPLASAARHTGLGRLRSWVERWAPAP